MMENTKVSLQLAVERRAEARRMVNDLNLRISWMQLEIGVLKDEQERFQCELEDMHNVVIGLSEKDAQGL